MRSVALAGVGGGPASTLAAQQRSQHHRNAPPARRGSCRAAVAAAAQTASPGARPAAAAVQGAKVRLLSLVTPTSRTGRGTIVANRQEILEAVADLKAAAAGSMTTGSFASATWELLWTTEKETLYIIKTAAPFFGTKAGPVYQVVDMQRSFLQNVITFPPDGAFIVDSSVEVAGPQRVNFRFNAAKLFLPDNKDIGLPPFGAGWFENIYLDQDLRISIDSRGDTLITRRAGPPLRFE